MRAQYSCYSNCSLAARNKNRGRERFAVLYTVVFGSQCLCKARCIARSSSSFGFQVSKHDNNAPPAFFCCRAEPRWAINPGALPKVFFSTPHVKFRLCVRNPDEISSIYVSNYMYLRLFVIGVTLQLSHCSHRCFKWVSFTGSWTWRIHRLFSFASLITSYHKDEPFGRA